VRGGGTTDEIVRRTLALAGGSSAVVAVLPQSSAVENAGYSSVKMWLDAGPKSAQKVAAGTNVTLSVLRQGMTYSLR
jgi:hypothetical protein